MSRKQIKSLKEASRGLISVDKNNLDATDKHILNKAYSICSQQLFKLTGKHFLEHEFTTPTEPYIK